MVDGHYTDDGRVSAAWLDFALGYNEDGGFSPGDMPEEIHYGDPE